MTTSLPVPGLSQPVWSQLNYHLTSGCARRWRTKVQDYMATHLKIIQSNKAKGMSANKADQKSSPPAWKQLKQHSQGKEVMPPTTNSKRPRVKILINDSHCVIHKGFVNMAGVKVIVLNMTSKKQTSVDIGL